MRIHVSVCLCLCVYACVGLSSLRLVSPSMSLSCVCVSCHAPSFFPSRLVALCVRVPAWHVVQAMLVVLVVVVQVGYSAPLQKRAKNTQAGKADNCVTCLEHFTRAGACATSTLKHFVNARVNKKWCKGCGSGPERCATTTSAKHTRATHASASSASSTSSSSPAPLASLDEHSNQKQPGNISAVATAAAVATNSGTGSVKSTPGGLSPLSEAGAVQAPGAAQPGNRSSTDAVAGDNRASGGNNESLATVEAGDTASLAPIGSNPKDDALGLGDAQGVQDHPMSPGGVLAGTTGTAAAQDQQDQHLTDKDTAAAKSSGRPSWSGARCNAIKTLAECCKYRDPRAGWAAPDCVPGHYKGGFVCEVQGFVTESKQEGVAEPSQCAAITGSAGPAAAGAEEASGNGALQGPDGASIGSNPTPLQPVDETSGASAKANTSLPQSPASIDAVIAHPASTNGVAPASLDGPVQQQQQQQQQQQRQHPEQPQPPQQVDSSQDPSMGAPPSNPFSVEQGVTGGQANGTVADSPGAIHLPQPQADATPTGASSASNNGNAGAPLSGPGRCTFSPSVVGSISDRNVAVFEETTGFDDCKQKCDEHPDCKSLDFEISTNRCMLGDCQIGKDGCENDKDTGYSYVACNPTVDAALVPNAAANPYFLWTTASNCPTSSPSFSRSKDCREAVDQLRGDMPTPTKRFFKGEYADIAAGCTASKEMAAYWNTITANEPPKANNHTLVCIRPGFDPSVDAPIDGAVGGLDAASQPSDQAVPAGVEALAAAGSTPSSANADSATMVPPAADSTQNPAENPAENPVSSAIPAPVAPGAPAATPAVASVAPDVVLPGQRVEGDDRISTRVYETYTCVCPPDVQDSKCKVMQYPWETFGPCLIPLCKGEQFLGPDRAKDPTGLACRHMGTLMEGTCRKRTAVDATTAVREFKCVPVAPGDSNAQARLVPGAAVPAAAPEVALTAASAPSPVAPTAAPAPVAPSAVNEASPIPASVAPVENAPLDTVAPAAAKNPQALTTAAPAALAPPTGPVALPATSATPAGASPLPASPVVVTAAAPKAKETAQLPPPTVAAITSAAAADPKQLQAQTQTDAPPEAASSEASASAAATDAPGTLPTVTNPAVTEVAAVSTEDAGYDARMKAQIEEYRNKGNKKKLTNDLIQDVAVEDVYVPDGKP